MRSLTIAVLAIAGVAISVPVTASPSVLGETHARAAGDVVQYAQYDPNDRAKGIIGLGYKSKKSKSAKSKKTDTSGQAKSSNTTK
jgi:hypothetical protein